MKKLKINIKPLKITHQSSKGPITLTIQFSIDDSCFPKKWKNHNVENTEADNYLKFYLEQKSDFDSAKINLLSKNDLDEIASKILETLITKNSLNKFVVDEENLLEAKKIIESKTIPSTSIFLKIAEIIEKSSEVRFKIPEHYSPETYKSISNSLKISEELQRFNEQQAIYKIPSNFLENPINDTNSHLKHSNEILLKVASSLGLLEEAALRIMLENEEKRNEDRLASKKQIMWAFVALIVPIFISAYQIYDDNNFQDKIIHTFKSNSENIITEIKSNSDILKDQENIFFNILEKYENQNKETPELLKSNESQHSNFKNLYKLEGR